MHHETKDGSDPSQAKRVFHPSGVSEIMALADLPGKDTSSTTFCRSRVCSGTPSLPISPQCYVQGKSINNAHTSDIFARHSLTKCESSSPRRFKSISEGNEKRKNRDFELFPCLVFRFFELFRSACRPPLFAKKFPHIPVHW